MQAFDKRVALTLVALGVLAVSLAASEAADNSATGRIAGLFSAEPMVDTGPSEYGGKHVYVHLPGLLEMKLDTRPDHGGMRLRQSVLMGLSRVYVNKKRNSTGQLQGPVEVRLWGLPLYRLDEPDPDGPKASQV